jgi:hypothetical protein
MPLSRIGRVLPEQLAIIAGKPPGILEAVLHGDIRDRAVVFRRAKDGMDRAEPAVTQEGDRAYPKRFVKRAVQCPTRLSSLGRD